MTGAGRILVVEDDPSGRRSIVDVLQDLGLQVSAAATGKEGISLFQQQRHHVVLSDLVLPDIDGIEVMKAVHQIAAETPVLIMTAYGSVPSSVKALQSGAYDYLTKPLDLDDIQSRVSRAMETARLRTEVDELQKTVNTRHHFDSIVAASASMQEVIRQARALSSTTATVLILGESGTGKEVIAKALHYNSKRAPGPFIALNCGAFSETLLESELFGHEKGAFTGASTQHKGAFERADGGTLFLDEIGDAPKAVQIKLLRVLEEREVLRVGGQTPFRVDVRVLSATHQDLDDLVEAGKFRTDLLYRLKVVTLRIPALRERPEDIRPLADRFIAEASREHGRHIATVEPSFIQALELYPWPGNVRELQHAIESAVVLSADGNLTANSLKLNAGATATGTGFVVPDGMTFSQLEKDILSQLLTRYKGNRTLTAEKLGLSRRTIVRKIEEYGLPF